MSIVRTLICPVFIVQSFRFKLALFHGFASLFVVLCAAVLIFLVWYPRPYHLLAGGTGLFGLLLGVDLITGPLLTFVVADPRKSRQVLRRDILVIAVFQLIALAYGLGTAYVARPVYLVHEVDRFQLVVAADIDDHDLRRASPEVRNLPLWGVKTIGVRQPRNGQEALESIEQAMAGRDVSLRPDWWVPMGPSQQEILAQRGQGLDRLRAKGPEASQKVDQALQDIGLPEADLWAFPVVARATGWSALVNRKTFQVEGFVEVDGF